MSLRALWVVDLDSSTLLLAKRFPPVESRYLRQQQDALLALQQQLQGPDVPDNAAAAAGAGLVAPPPGIAAAVQAFSIQGLPDAAIVSAVADRLASSGYALTDAGPFISALSIPAAGPAAAGPSLVGPFVVVRPARGAAFYVRNRSAPSGGSAAADRLAPATEGGFRSPAASVIATVYDSPDDVPLPGEPDPLLAPLSSLLLVALVATAASPLDCSVDAGHMDAALTSSSERHGLSSQETLASPCGELVAAYALLRQGVAPFVEHTLIVCPAPEEAKPSSSSAAVAFRPLPTGPAPFEVVGGWSALTTKRRVVKHRTWLSALHLLLATALPFGHATPMLPSHHAGAMLALASSSDCSSGLVMSPALEPEALYQRLESGGGGDTSKMYRGSEMIVVGGQAKNSPSSHDGASASLRLSTAAAHDRHAAGGEGAGQDADFATTSTTAALPSVLPEGSSMPIWIQETVTAQLFGKAAGATSSSSSSSSNNTAGGPRADLLTVATAIQTKAPQSPDLRWMEDVESARTRTFGAPSLPLAAGGASGSGGGSLLAALDYFPVAVLGMPALPNLAPLFGNSSTSAISRSTPLVVDETLVADVQHWPAAGLILPAQPKRKAFFGAAGGSGASRESDLIGSVAAAIHAAQMLQALRQNTTSSSSSSGRPAATAAGDDAGDDASGAAGSQDGGVKRTRIGVSVLHIKGLHQLGYQRTSGLFRPEAAEHQPHTLLAFANDVCWPPAGAAGPANVLNPSAGKIFTGDFSLIPLLSPTDVEQATGRLKKDVAAAVAANPSVAASSGAVDEAAAQVQWIQTLLEEKRNHVLLALSLEITLNLADCGASASASTSQRLPAVDAKADLTRLEVLLSFLDHARVSYFYFPALLDSSSAGASHSDAAGDPQHQQHQQHQEAAGKASDRVQQLRPDALRWRIRPTPRLRHGHVFRLRGFVVVDLSHRLPPGVTLEPTTLSSNDHVPDLRSLATVLSSAALHFALRVDRPILPFSVSLLDPLTLVQLGLNPPPGSGATIDTSNAEAVELRTTLNSAPALCNRHNELGAFPQIARVELPVELAVTGGEDARLAARGEAVGRASFCPRVVASGEGGYVLWNFTAS